MTQTTIDFRPVRMGRIHAAKLENSPRLQRVLALLQRGGRYSTRQIIRLCDVCCVNTAMSELKANGIQYHCRQVGRGRYEYWL